MTKKRALISVSNKDRLEDLLEALEAAEYEIISSSGTAKFIKEHGFRCIEVSDLTLFPEILGGRVKTLHPKIFGGILADASKAEHLEDLENNDLSPIDLVVVNLYPFDKQVDDNTELSKAIELIDVGGPSLQRAAAKNFKNVTALSDPSDYNEYIEIINSEDKNKLAAFRIKQSQKVFTQTSNYDSLISNYLNKQILSSASPAAEGTEAAAPMPENLNLQLKLAKSLSYGENPHQRAALYVDPSEKFHGLADAKQLHGKQLSFNNLLDLSSAWNIAQEYEEKIPCAAVIKHNNPCGVAIAPNIAQAFIEAFACDSVSAFGGIVALNNPCDAATAVEMKDIFLEAIIAPKFTDEALQILTQKKNLRLIELPNRAETPKEYDVKRIEGAYLVQENNRELLDQEKVKNVTKNEVSEDLWVDLVLAWKVVKHVKSNAIVAAQSGRAIGIGAGQTNRVKSVQDALKNFDMDTRGAVLASDGFFPFADNVDLAAQNNIAAIIQPGGSIRDEEVIKAANEAGIPMLFTGIRHFKH